MPSFATPAILIRRTEYGDYDLILTFFSLSMGKLSLIAKSAKKSSKRFAGILELFSEIDIVGGSSRNRGMPVLQEATLREPFQAIRAAVTKTAYASYWAELVNNWMEEHAALPELFYLLHHALGGLDRGEASEAALSILFQMRFLRLSGHSPNFEACVVCRRELENIRHDTLAAEVAKGGIACPGCVPAAVDAHCLSKGTVKQLLWVAGGDLARAARMKFTPQAVREGLGFLERFVPYHLGRQPRSLKVLHQLRRVRGAPA